MQGGDEDDNSEDEGDMGGDTMDMPVHGGDEEDDGKDEGDKGGDATDMHRGDDQGSEDNNRSQQKEGNSSRGGKDKEGRMKRKHNKMMNLPPERRGLERTVVGCIRGPHKR